MDVVAEGDHDEEVSPFSGEVRDGFLHGRGAMDIKGLSALQTYAAASMIGALEDVVVIYRAGRTRRSGHETPTRIRFSDAGGRGYR